MIGSYHNFEKTPTKEEMIIYMEDKLLYDRNVDEGTKVIIDEDGRLQKA